jgi:thiol-disulfide isomerase/thioredoxin
MNKKHFAIIFILTLFIFSCSQNIKQKEKNKTKDSIKVAIDSVRESVKTKETKVEVKNDNKKFEPKNISSKVIVYNFHGKIRCSSCIAIEEATTETLNTYFKKEMKEGKVNRVIVDVDDEANKKIAEKYQVFGSGLIISKIYNNQETSIDMTGDGFKFASNKKERFINLLKNKINEYLK